MASSALHERVLAAQPYWDAYWRGEAPMLNAVVPNDPGSPVPKPPLGITWKTDLDALADSLLRWEAANVFLGGAIPGYCVYLFDVYNPLGVFLGGQVEECGDSHRMIPFVHDLDTARLEFDRSSPLAARLGDIAGRLRERCEGRVLISASAIGANLDALEAVRGSTELLMDLVDNPGGVQRCLAQIDAAAAQMLAFHAELYDFAAWGSLCRHGMYSRGRVGVPQCDFGYMIGPRHFAEFAMPWLRREFARLDGVCYHLDGIGNLPNLEALCAEPRLHLIQWVPGTGHERDDWSALRERIAGLGKGQMLGGTVRSFAAWYARHPSPWQHWSIGGTPRADILACLRDLGFGA